MPLDPNPNPNSNPSRNPNPNPNPSPNPNQVAECRSARERYFFTCALSFFCGWSWVAVARDALALPTPYLRNDLQLNRTVGAATGLELA